MSEGEKEARPDAAGDAETQPGLRRLLIVDDDQPFRNRLARAMKKRGFEVTAVESLS